MGTKITYSSFVNQPKEELKSIRKSLNRKENKVVKSEKELKKELKNPLNHYMVINDNGVFAINKLKYKNHIFQLLEGNPVTYYFSVAYDVLPQIEEARLYFLDSYKGPQSEFRWKSSVAFSYIFKVGSIGVIFSFFALEAFINQCLPDYAKINYKGKQVTKEYIERFMKFEDKLKVIMPAVTGKNFIEDHPRKAEMIAEIKKLRDALTHLKENRKIGFVAYEKINNKILNFDLRRAVNTIKFYINYHQSKTIQNYKDKRTTGRLKVTAHEFGEDEKGYFIKQYYVPEVKNFIATRFNDEVK